MSADGSVGRAPGRRARRRFLRGAGAAAAAAVAGCAGRGTSGGGSGERTGRGGGAVTLEYVDVAGTRSREVFEPALETLNDAHDATVSVEFSEVPYENMKGQLMTRVGGGNAPDVAAVDQIWLGEFIDGGNLLPLDGVADGIDFDDYLPALREPLRSDGRVYGIPVSTDVRGMYWNKRAFERAGLDPERPPETWPELLDVAETLYDPPEQYGAAYFVVAGRWTVDLFSAGGRILDESGTEPGFQRTPGVRAASFLDDLYNGRAVGPPEPAFRDGAQLAREFLTGQHAITVVEGSWLDYFWQNMGNDVASMVRTFGFAATPHVPGGEPATMSGGFAWTGFESTDHPDVVRDFLRIVGGRSFKRHLARTTGDLPTRQSLQDDPEIWENVPYADTVRELLPVARTRPIRHWSTVAEALDPALQRVAFDRETPEVALARAADEVRASLG